MTEHRLEPYRASNILEFMRAALNILGQDFETNLHREARSSEDEFEVYTRWYGSDEIGIQLEERNGVDPRTGYVNRERTRALLNGLQDVKLEVETVDGVFEGSFVTLRIETSAELEVKLLEVFDRIFSKKLQGNLHID